MLARVFGCLGPSTFLDASITCWENLMKKFAGGSAAAEEDIQILNPSSASSDREISIIESCKILWSPQSDLVVKMEDGEDIVLVRKYLPCRPSGSFFTERKKFSNWP